MDLSKTMGRDGESTKEDQFAILHTSYLVFSKHTDMLGLCHCSILQNILLYILSMLDSFQVARHNWPPAITNGCELLEGSISKSGYPGRIRG